ncbi:FtsB family cell division protein [Bailinhaonella thermotolerans]|uniref:Septum formation initiator family protein n=1 Tax=Bailinhaonella thermotolerans TaxID=1070861 RepID=A0A3A4AY14_9ACTN|nr:septum formation initiator family protein [Bailinhaonella thermotolerans]RJL33299.1 septum formation initiator family protein [Bailinhaonella thermotolerans]
MAGRRFRPQFTGRAAILAVVVCAIAMSLAYPVREYVSQRNQIAQLEEQARQASREVDELQKRRRQLEDPDYIAREARRRLHFCGQGEKCYVVLDEPRKGTRGASDKNRPAPPATGEQPWYQVLWESVEAADRGVGRRATGGNTPG